MFNKDFKDKVNELHRWYGTKSDATKDEKELDQIKFHESLRNEHRQYIYFGAPGTGKSHQLNEKSKLFASDNVERTTFHPNMTYGQFIGVFKPFSKSDGGITYRFIPGVLMKQLVKALLNPESAILLIVEELNRANTAGVFGDMFQLLDRNSDFDSEYPINISEDIEYYFRHEVYPNCSEDQVNTMKEKLKKGLVFPSNLFIWTTMNSADQGVMPLDTAFKRRWEQLYFGIDDAYEGDKEAFENYCSILVPDSSVYNAKIGIEWNRIRVFINQRLTELKVPEDKLLGPYFLSKNVLSSTDEELTKSFKGKVLMYLFEDAGKQKRRDLFTIPNDRLLYSEVVKGFDEKGMDVFSGWSKMTGVKE